ncbi:MAG: hypothetical protein IKZ66_01135 [Schwartzia sp.]|nr:hypothetical protein [Schwartzia sp. (in: firmicutes)]
MTGKKADKGETMAGVREMDELFRRTDFAAEHPGLSERLQEKIRARLSAQEIKMHVEERELFEDELSELAAAGAPEMKEAEMLRNVLRSNDRGRP